LTIAETAQSKQARLEARGYLIALAAVLAWASTAVFIRYLLDHYPLAPLTLAFWRDLFVAACLAGLLWVRRRKLPPLARRDLPFFLLYGSLGLAAFNALWTQSVAYNGAAVATVLAYTSPAFVAVAARWLFREPLTPIKLVALVLSLTGCTLVSGAYDLAAWSVRPIGIGVGLSSGLGFASYSLFGKWAAGRHDPSKTTLYGFAFAAGFLLLTQRPATLLSLGPEPLGWAILIVLAAGPTLGGYGLYTLSLTYLPASVASLIAALEPALTALMAFALLGEQMTGLQIVGGGLILGAVLLLTRGKSRSSS
jgi:drug/metabolite transporter (DMT)-like permease